MRLPLALPFAGILTGQAQQVLFRDTFNRPDNRNIDAVLTGITNNTGTSLSPPNLVNKDRWFLKIVAEP